MAAATPPPTSPEDARRRRILLIMFVTLFVDLAGFSIIFPLFPQMLDYYTTIEGETGMFGRLITELERFSELAGAPSDFGIIVLFGGVLSAAYSLLQFFFAPIFGSISDRIGRKPVLIISISGIAVSYVLWLVAGQFWILVLGRVVGGIMSANISTASAVVADVTTDETRSRGMAVIGMAFGLGFIVGPAIGGLAALWDMSAAFPSLEAYGINPFSSAALAALILSLFNLAFVVLRFPETLKPNADTERPRRVLNPFALFGTEDYPGVTRTNLTNFLFLVAFSGMEFSLTFLAKDRLNYTPQQNVWIFLFIGFVLAGVQGGYVRRRSTVIGPRRMAMHGLICCYPGLIFIGLANSSWMLFAGLFLMAAGGAQVLPCLTALSSVYAPSQEQGRILGVFRSLGALGRAVGPLIACVLYWRLGPTITYHAAAASLFFPLLLAASLPRTDASEGTKNRSQPAGTDSE